MIINRIFLNEVHSTNAFANELVAKNTPNEGTVISTHHQTQGRGQIGRNWDSGKDKNLSFSLILYPKHLQPQDHFQLNMLVSISLCNVLQKNLSQPVHIKWPNDIIIENKKIAGILIQSSMTPKVIQSAVAGIGLNVLQTHFSDSNYRATSMQLLNPTKKYYLDDLENLICQEILENYYAHKNNDFQGLKYEYLQKLFKRGEMMSFQRIADKDCFDAEIIGVDTIGRLSLHVEGKIKYFQMGELKMLFDA